jgi:hypothetical protein
MSITEDNIKAVIATLAAERAAVDASSASDSQKNSALSLIDRLTNGLKAALQDGELTWNGWVQGLGPLFSDLSIELKGILGSDTGACDYNGNCIETTSDVCAALPNSIFHSGVPCTAP